MHRNVPASFIWALLVMPVFAGCGPSASSRLLGKWELDVTKSISDFTAGKDEPGTPFVAGIMKEEAKDVKVEIEFEAGGVMTITAPSFVGKPHTRNGTWKVSRVSGNKVTIWRKLDGDSADHEAKLKFVDNDTLEMPLPVFNSTKIPATFRRAKTS